MTTAFSLKRILPAVLGISFVGVAHAAVPVIDLGVASGYSGFFYGNVSNVADVEGKLAVGGNLTTSGFSIGYRVPNGTAGPAVVIGGNAALGDGTIYGPAPAGVDTNASIGPVTEYTKNWNGYGVYGGSNTSKSYLTLNKQANAIDFGAAKTQLTQLSSTLNSQSAHGAVVIDGSGMHLTGDGVSDVQVFDVNTRDLKNLVLSNVKSNATVIINVTGTGAVNFTGGQDGELEALRGHVLYNLNDATTVNVGTFVYGSVLANAANLIGTGHLEGNIIAQSMTGKVEIGYEPFSGRLPTSPVPEPESWAMLLAGLGVAGWMARRRAR